MVSIIYIQKKFREWR